MKDAFFKYCTLTAVSSDVQASERKPSLDHQQKISKQYGEECGGMFTREYRIDGYHRTGYWDLSEAERDIPPLAELIRDAITHEYDVIIMESFDRLRDIAWALWMRIKPLKIQIRSAQEDLRIVAPDRYDPTNDRLTPKALSGSLADTDYAIGKINRAFSIGNEQRAKDGVYSIHYGYGYVLVNKDTDELAIDETVAALLIKFKDKFLAGESLPKIADFGNASGIPSPKGSIWRSNSITYILRNPFYAGKTFHGRGYINELGTYTTRTDAELFDGKHEPLWSYDTHLRILAEYERRNSLHSVPKDYNFTGLLKCAVCGETLRTIYGVTSGASGRRFRYWWCRGHVSIRHDRANGKVANAITELYNNHERPKVSKEKTKSRVQKSKAAIEREMMKLEQAYNADAYTATEYATRRNDLKKKQAELEDTERQEEEGIRSQTELVQWIEEFTEFLPVIHYFVANHPPEQVKFRLSRIAILAAHPDKRITAEFASSPKT